MLDEDDVHFGINFSRSFGQKSKVLLCKMLTLAIVLQFECVFKITFLRYANESIVDDGAEPI